MCRLVIAIEIIPKLFFQPNYINPNLFVGVPWSQRLASETNSSFLRRLFNETPEMLYQISKLGLTGRLITRLEVIHHSMHSRGMIVFVD
jgi:hypothetical protein